MFRLLLLILIIAGVAAYFTKPDEATLRAAAETEIQTMQQEAVDNFDLGGLLGTGIASLMNEGTYSDYYVASRYSVTVRDAPFLECFGAYTKTYCRRLGQNETQAQPAEAAH